MLTEDILSWSFFFFLIACSELGMRKRRIEAKGRGSKTVKRRKESLNQLQGISGFLTTPQNKTDFYAWKSGRGAGLFLIV